MASIPFHTHTFPLPTASTADIEEGVSTTQVITPAEFKPLLDNIYAGLPDQTKIVTPYMLDAVGDGVTEEGSIIAALIARQKATGAKIYIPFGCDLLNSQTHVVDYDGFDIVGGGTISHNLDNAPIFVLGTSTVRIKRPHIKDMLLRNVATPRDLWNDGDCPLFPGTTVQQWFGAIYARNTEGARIIGNTCEDFFKMVFFDGKHDDTAQSVWHEDLIVAFNTAIRCTYLMTGNVMDGWHFHANTMLDPESVQTATGPGDKPRQPHIIYKIDRSVPDAKNFSVTDNVVYGNTYGSCYVFRGAENGIVSGNYSQGAQAIMADACVNVKFANHLHIALEDGSARDQFFAGFESRGCKRCTFTDMDIHLTNAFGYGMRLVGNGSSNPVERYGEHNVVKDIRLHMDDTGSLDRPPIEIQAERDLTIEDVSWVYNGTYNVYPIRINVSDDDPANKVQRLKVINPRINKSASGSDQDDVLHAVAGSTDSATLIIDTDLLNFAWGSSSVLDPDGVVKVVVNGQRTGTWTPVLIGLTTAGTNTYAAQEGEWLRDGDLVQARCRITLTGALDSTGTMRVDGLPFLVKTSPSINTPGIADLFSNITLASGEILQVSAVTNSTQVALRALSNTGTSVLSHTAFGSDASFEFVLTYRTSAAF